MSLLEPALKLQRIVDFPLAHECEILTTNEGTERRSS